MAFDTKVEILRYFSNNQGNKSKTKKEFDNNCSSKWAKL